MVWIPGLTTTAVLPPPIQRLLDLGGTPQLPRLGMVGRVRGPGPTWPDQSVVRQEKYERPRGKRMLHCLIIVNARIVVLGLMYVILPRGSLLPFEKDVVLEWVLSHGRRCGVCG